MAKSRISPDEVKHVATLSRLALSPAELEKVHGNLDRILDYVAALEMLDVSNVSPTSHVLDLSAPLREDVVGEALNREVALSQAPAPEDNAFSVPKVIEVEG